MDDESLSPRSEVVVASADIVAGPRVGNGRRRGTTGICPCRSD